MLQFLATDLFRYVVFPLGSVLLGVGLKAASRNDRYAVFRKEDIAVGLDLMLFGCLLFIVLTTDRALALLTLNDEITSCLGAVPLDAGHLAALQGKATVLTSGLATAGWTIALLFIALGSVSHIVRRWGWRSDNDLKPIIGIAVPLCFGIFTLIVVMTGAGE